MTVERSIAAAAIVASLPFGALAHQRHPIDIPANEGPEVAAPFIEKTTYSISVEDAAQLSIRQRFLSGSSSDSVRISFTAPKTDTERFLERTPSDLIIELKRVSGLTWAQISDVFGVDSRALHYWKAGKPVSAENHQKLGRAVAMLHHIDRGTAEENKRLLLSEARGGKTFLEFAKAGDFQSILELAGKGSGRVTFGHKLSEEARSLSASPNFAPVDEGDDVEVQPIQRLAKKKVKFQRKPTNG